VFVIGAVFVAIDPRSAAAAAAAVDEMLPALLSIVRFVVHVPNSADAAAVQVIAQVIVCTCRGGGQRTQSLGDGKGCEEKTVFLTTFGRRGFFDRFSFSTTAVEC
jgi:hypothetical protein